jgi:hypothetical protein
VKVACLRSKFTCTFFAHGKDASASCARGAQPFGQVMPETSTVTFWSALLFSPPGSGESCLHPAAMNSAPIKMSETILASRWEQRMVSPFRSVKGFRVYPFSLQNDEDSKGAFKAAPVSMMGATGFVK